MNSVILIGRLAKDPELSYTPNNNLAICKFTLAVDRPKKDGQDQGADFIGITVFGRQAETSDRYLSKGRQAAIQGRIQTGSYKNQKGDTVYTTDIIADRVEFLGSSDGQNSARGAQNNGNGNNYQPQQNNAPQGNFQDTGFQQMDVDVPW